MTQISFGTKSILKTLYEKGSLDIKYGIYGGVLSRDPQSFDAATIEHIEPQSKGGHSCLANFALATKRNNGNRSNQPLYKVFNKEAFDQYCEEFKDVEIPYESGVFKGNNYIELLTKTVKRVLKKEGHLDIFG